jgi:ankyrin repeat protein/uncharacterized protein YegL
MCGEPIEAVKVGLDKLLSSLRRDPYALESVYLSLIVFNKNANVLVPITELSEFCCPEIILSNSPKRNIGLGFQLLLARYKKEVRRTTTEEKGDWLPIVVLMTGGEPSDLERFKNILPQFKEYPFAKKIVCVTGLKSKTTILRNLTCDIFVLDIMDSHAFSRFWKWVSTVAGAQSRSLGQLHEELPPPPPELNPFYSNSDTNVIESVTVKKSIPVLPPILPPPIPNIDIFKAIQQSDLVTVKQLLQIDPNLVRARNFDYTPLHYAIINFNVEIIKYLIEHGADVNAETSDDFTPPLHLAIEYNFNVKIIKYLVEQGANINAETNNGYTPLHWAACNNSNVEVLQYLISQGVNVNAENYHGKTPLDVADTEEKKQILINAGAKTVTKYSPPSKPNIDIFEAIRQGDLITVKKLLQKDGKLIFARNNLGDMSLHYAAKFNSNVDILKYLISQGSNVNAKNNHGKTPLDVANTEEKKQILINAGAKIATKYSPPSKPNIDIFDAIKQSDLITVKQLLQKDGKLIFVRDYLGDTLLHYAVMFNSNVDILKYLISQRADVNAKNNESETPLHWAAAYNSNVDILKYLISQGADINTKNNESEMPLHRAAAYNSNVGILKYLILQGADVNAKNNESETPLHRAAMFNSNIEILNYLISQRADVNAKDINGKTPLDVANTEKKKQILAKQVLQNQNTSNTSCVVTIIFLVGVFLGIYCGWEYGGWGVILGTFLGGFIGLIIGGLILNVLEKNK